jgi:hypothetical protein
MRIAKHIYGSISTIESRTALLDQAISRVRQQPVAILWVTLTPAFPAPLACADEKLVIDVGTLTVRSGNPFAQNKGTLRVSTDDFATALVN